MIYIKRQGLEIFASGKSPLILNFSSDLVSAEEIKDKEKLRVQIADFLNTNKLLKIQAVIVLAEELIFKSELAQKDKFLEELPFSPEKIVAKTYTDKNLVIAANGELFKILTEEIIKTGGQVSFVVPQTLLETPTIGVENFNKIIGNKKLLQSTNLLVTNDNNQRNNLIKPIILSLILIFLLGSGGAYYLRTKKNPAKDNINKSATQETEKAKPTIESTIAKTKAKKDIFFKILNGTGTAGDAKKVKDILTPLGYQNMETGNLEEQNAVNSTIIYSAASASYLPEITKSLQTLFELEPKSLSTDSASFDLQIITGK